MYRKLLFGVFCFSGLVWHPFALADQCVLSMGFHTNERLPFIQRAPNNTGFYFDFYERAAKRIGCELRVLRASRKRILRELEFGRVDFYPSLNYSPEHHEFAHFIPNGLKSRDIAISLQQEDDITGLEQLSTRNKTVLITPESAIQGKIPAKLEVTQLPELDASKAIDLIIDKHGDFFIFDEVSIRYHLAEHPQANIKLHDQCCETTAPLYLGFSRQSHYFATTPNPDFDPQRPISPTNQPLSLKANTKVAQFASTLSSMAKKGITPKLFGLYFDGGHK